MEGIVRLIEALARWFRQDEAVAVPVPIAIRSHTQYPGGRRRR